MARFTFLFSATGNCVKSTTASTVTGLVLFAAIVGGLIALAVANGRARRRLSAANAELSFLRPENARLHEWIAHLSGSPVDPGSAGGSSAAPPLPARWHADPSRRHELRFWDGEQWTEHVSDHGQTSTDPPQ